jgi:hypothetical protein
VCVTGIGTAADGVGDIATVCVCDCMGVEKRAQDSKSQVSELLRTEWDLLQQRKQDTFRLERQELQLKSPLYSDFT